MARASASIFEKKTTFCDQWPALSLAHNVCVSFGLPCEHLPRLHPLVSVADPMPPLLLAGALVHARLVLALT